jgi:serine phosphatase RsbU (regulator of sigma subunit)
VLLAALSIALAASLPLVRGLRLAVFDGYQRLFPLERTTTVVTIVAIDEASIARYGQWPWPRTRVAELVGRIGEYGSASIGFDIFFPEPDRFSPAAIAAELPVVPTELAHSLALLPSNDEVLARSIRGHHVVLGIASGAPDPRFPAPPRAPPIAMPAEGLPDIDSLPGHIGNVPVISAAAESRGLMDAGPESEVVRQVPMVRRVQGALVASLGVETLRVAEDAGLKLEPARGGLINLRLGDHATTIQEDGTAWLRMGPHDPQRFVSALDVMERRVNPELLNGRAVLLGIDGIGVQDYKTTPLGEFVPGVEIHAQVIENLFGGVKLVRPAYASLMEAGALAACGLLLIVLLPRMSALQGTHLAFAMVLLLTGSGLVAFLYFDTLLDPAGPAIGTLAVFASVMVGTLSEAERQRRQLREQAARMAGEVDAARRIQMGLLPDPHAALGHDPRYGIAALLEPARTVGGDFYDFFMVDERRLFFVVADVSGKGLPAALFMAAVKSNLKGAALRGGSVGEILTRAQAQIALENPEQLFVTVFAGLLDLDSGHLEYANAGHEPPFSRLERGVPERFGSSGGPPLCVIEDFVFPTQGRTLAAGEWLCVVTDGATEAMNESGAFFSSERLRASLTWVGKDATPDEVMARVRDDVARFVGQAEIADDITLLVLRWKGGQEAAPSER